MRVARFLGLAAALAVLHLAVLMGLGAGMLLLPDVSWLQLSLAWICVGLSLPFGIAVKWLDPDSFAVGLAIVTNSAVWGLGLAWLVRRWQHGKPLLRSSPPADPVT